MASNLVYSDVANEGDLRPFELKQVVPDSPDTITCLTYNEQYVYVGTHKGSVVKYQRNGPGSRQTLSFLDKKTISKSKKEIVQLDVIPSLNIILCLTEGVIHLLDPEKLDILNGTIREKSDFVCFARQLQRPGCPARLCCLTKKRKFLFYKARRRTPGDVRTVFDAENTLSTTRDPINISFVDEAVCVSFQEAYNVLHRTSGAVRELGAHTPPRGPWFKLIPDAPCNAKVDTDRLRKLSCEDAVSLAASAPSDHDAPTVVLAGDGQRSSHIYDLRNIFQAEIEWSYKISSMAYCFPHLVGYSRDDNCLEVVFAPQRRRVQSIGIPGGSHFVGICDGWPDFAGSKRGRNAIFAATSNSIYQLVQCPPPQLCRQLVEYGDTMAAYHTMLYCNTSHLNAAATEIRAFHKLTGRFCVLDLKFEIGIHHLRKADIDVREYLAILPELHRRVQNPLNGYVPVLFTPSVTDRATQVPVREMKLLEFGQSMATTSTPVTSVRSLLSIVKATLQRNGRSATDTAAQKTLKPAFEAAQTWLESIRKQLRASVNAEELTVLSRNRTKDAMIHVIVDSALLKCYVILQKNEEALKFSKSISFVDLDDARPILERRNMYDCLGHLLLQSGQEASALSVWRSVGIGEAKQSDFDPVHDTIEILRTISDEEIVLEYSQWVLQKSPLEAMSIFTSPNRSTSLVADTVLRHLQQIPEANTHLLTKTYLEYLVNDLKMREERFHTALCQSYIGELRIALGSDPTGASNYVQKIREPLQNLLHESHSFNEEIVLRELAGTILYEEQMIVLSKLGRHREALQLLLSELRDHDAAENYCWINRQQINDSFESNPFMVLLDLYFAKNVSSRDMETYQENAFRIMTKYFAYVDIRSTLKLAPGSITVHKLLPLARLAFPMAAHVRRQNQVAHALAHFDRLNAGCSAADARGEFARERVEAELSGANSGQL